jgi:plasmid stabilization system protein ParE
MIIVLTEAARDELLAARIWYDEQGAVGDAFADDIDVTIGHIEQHPLLATQIRPGLHRALLRRHPYSIIYHVIGDQIRIIAIAHQRRRPDYWRARLP